MKKFYHKILSVIMAFVVLLSTMSFTIDFHYCGDLLVD
ncbi:HYC_CC_PP family protein, partial [Maribacter hydrothermalis]